MKKLPKEMMEYWNSILVVNNCILKISSYEKSKIIFNNGLIIEGKNDIQNFTRRLKKYVLYIDDLYNSDITIRKNTIKTIKSLGCRSGGQMNVKLHKEEMIRNIHSVSPWHKGSKGLIKIWNKGLTKDNDERIKKYYSEGRMGSNNPSYGVSPSIESRKKQSDSIKLSIKKGMFTPNIHNSLTHKNIIFNGQKYRSSWEVLFSFLHPECLYEKIRISYFYKNVESIYIVDFVDYNKKILYEIKPTAHKENSKIKKKIESGIEWSKNNGYQYKIITENELFFDLNIEVLNVFDNHTKKLLMRSYETYKKNRNS
ncbi:MAG: hypothetical protein WC346_06305 [Methanogenium sp.]|jgi:hypothetical protein